MWPTGMCNTGVLRFGEPISNVNQKARVLHGKAITYCFSTFKTSCLDFICHNLLKSVEITVMFCNHLFLLSLCLALCSFFVSVFLFPVVYGWPVPMKKKKAETTVRISLCLFSPLLLDNTLIWKTCSAPSFIPFVQLRQCWVSSQNISTPILSVGSAALFLLSINPLCSTVAFAPVFSQEHNTTQTARGNLNWEALKRRWRIKLYLATCSTINQSPLMVQLPISKRSDGIPTSHRTTLS